MAKNDDKPLLNEGTVRRFMKLAEIGGLSDKFVGDIYEQEEEEELPPEGLEAGAEEELPPEPGMEEEPPLEEPGLEAGAEMEPAPPEGGMGEEELNQFVEDVIAGVASAAADLGVDVDVEGAAGRADAGEEEAELERKQEKNWGLGHLARKWQKKQAKEKSKADYERGIRQQKDTSQRPFQASADPRLSENKTKTK